MTRSTLEQALGFDIPLIVPIMLILYIAVIMVVGLWAAKKVKNSEDWFVGGRSMGPWITALAHGSSSLGGGMYIAGPQYGWGGRSLFSLGSSRRCVRTHLEFRYHRQENEKIYRKSQSTDYS